MNEDRDLAWLAASTDSENFLPFEHGVTVVGNRFATEPCVPAEARADVRRFLQDAIGNLVAGEYEIEQRLVQRGDHRPVAVEVEPEPVERQVSEPQTGQSVTG